MKKELFKEMLSMIQSTYNETYKDVVIKFMWQSLKEYSDTDFKNSCSELITAFVPTVRVPLPLIPHYLKGMGRGDNDQAIRAILKVKEASWRMGQYRSVNFGDSALHKTIENYGGWPVVAMWGEKDWGYTEKKFSDTYKSLIKDKTVSNSYLIGISEESNLKNGFKSDPPKRIELPWSNFQIEYKKKEEPIGINFNNVVKGVE